MSLWALLAALSLLSLAQSSRAQQTALSRPAQSARLPLPLAPPAAATASSAAKRSFHGLRCRGVYDKGTFYELEAVCRDCLTIYQEPELYGLCRSQCFTTPYFVGCLEALQQGSEAERLDAAIRRLSGRK